jgi:hypothetical protein
MNARTRALGLSQLWLLAAAITLGYAPTGIAQDEKPKPQVLITNVNIFDGFSDKLATGMSVLVEGNHIKEVGKSIKPMAQPSSMAAGAP